MTARFRRILLEDKTWKQLAVDLIPVMVLFVLTMYVILWMANVG